MLGNVGHEMIVADFLPSPSSLQRWLTIVMDPWIILTIGVSVGIVLGALVAAICLVERPKWWTIILRMPKGLHRRLRHDAKNHMQSLKDEIVSRLQRSVDEDHPKR